MIKFLTDELGKLSSKRLVGILSAMCLIFITIMDAFRDVTISENLINCIFYLCLGTLGFTSVDKFINPK